MQRSRVLAWALAGSLVVHLVTLGVPGRFLPQPAAELDFPIEASLLAADEPEPAPSAPKRVKPAETKPVVSVPPEVQPASPAPAPETVEPEPSAPELPAPEILPEPVAAPPALPPALPPAPVERPTPAPEPMPRLAVRALPGQLTLEYSVQMGDGDEGFVAGRATYVWQVQNGRYSLSSTIEATGLAALFVSGRIVQSSEGAVDVSGLRPEQYWLQRNERKQDIARFDWATRRLNLNGGREARLTPQGQDLLSFPFHLAITVTEAESAFALGVTNGRKFNEYEFRVLGRQVLELKGRKLDTLHLQGSKVGVGTLDVWLDLGRSGLPARIRTLDRNGKVMELRLQGGEKTPLGSGG